MFCGILEHSPDGGEEHDKTHDRHEEVGLVASEARECFHTVDDPDGKQVGHEGEKDTAHDGNHIQDRRVENAN